VFSALEVCYENALYKFTFDIDIDIDIANFPCVNKKAEQSQR